MDAAYISAMFGLGGATVGALASFMTTWVTHRTQFRDKIREAERTRHIELFNEFITESVRLFSDALTHEPDEVNDLALLYALVARMNLTASQSTVDAARHVIDKIVNTYMESNKNFHEIRELARNKNLDFLAEFATSCRKDLRVSLAAQ